MPKICTLNLKIRGIMIIGYARVSTNEQRDILQIDALKQAGCIKIFTDRTSGAYKKRPGLSKAMGSLKNGDTLIVWKLDRLGRSLIDLVEIVNSLKGKGINFLSLQESINTNTGVGKLTFHIFASIAEFERDIIKERTMAGILAARKRGRIGGRPRALTQNEIIKAKELHKVKALAVSDICNIFDIGRSTFYRYINTASNLN